MVSSQSKHTFITFLQYSNTRKGKRPFIIYFFIPKGMQQSRIPFGKILSAAFPPPIIWTNLNSLYTEQIPPHPIHASTDMVYWFSREARKAGCIIPPEIDIPLDVLYWPQSDRSCKWAGEIQDCLEKERGKDEFICI